MLKTRLARESESNRLGFHSIPTACALGIDESLEEYRVDSRVTGLRNLCKGWDWDCIARLLGYIAGLCDFPVYRGKHSLAHPRGNQFPVLMNVVLRIFRN